jgi:hypothetical protein
MIHVESVFPAERQSDLFKSVIKQLKHSRVDVPEGEPESLLLLIEWQKTRAFF